MKIILSKHKQEWNVIFQKEKELLLSTLKKYNPTIEHIGSTAVKDIIAKPIIDIMLGINNIHSLDSIVSIIKKLKYLYVKKYESVIPERRFFIKPKKEILISRDLKLNPENMTLTNRLIHLHVVKINTKFWNEHILFRNLLINNKRIRKEYETLKLELAQNEWAKTEYYDSAKTDFIKEVIKKNRN